MKALCFAAVILLTMGGIAFAQQDPDDPGIQDSIIFGGAYYDSGYTHVIFPIYAVTDDSVMFYNLPLRWNAPLGGILPSTPNAYFNPINGWDVIFDSVIISQNYIRQIGFADIDTLHDNQPLNTNGYRIHIMDLRFIFDPRIQRQVISVDTTYDDRNGSIILGLVNGSTEITPAFIHGFAYLSAIDEGENPGNFNLGQNYPNPFNPSTEIRFALARDGQASLVIYDLLGREVRRLLDTRMNSGSYSLRWDGKDASGVDVPSGVYLYKLASLGFSESKRMTLIR